MSSHSSFFLCVCVSVSVWSALSGWGYWNRCSENRRIIAGQRNTFLHHFQCDLIEEEKNTQRNENIFRTDSITNQEFQRGE